MTYSRVSVFTFTCCAYRKLGWGTGKSLSEALLFAEHGENMLCTKIVLMSEIISVLNKAPQV